MRAVSETGISQGRFVLPWRSLLMAVAAISVYLVLGPSPDSLVFDRAGIAQGEWWRLVTGHWVHSDPTHAAWDITALIVLGALFETRLRWRLLLVLLLASAGVDAWLWWGDPTLQLYCGLSGILNGLLIVGLVNFWQGTRHPVIWLTAVGAILKIAVEITVGHSMLVQTAWSSVPAAHAAGLLSGVVFMAGTWMRDACHQDPDKVRSTEVMQRIQAVIQ